MAFTDISFVHPPFYPTIRLFIYIFV